MTITLAVKPTVDAPVDADDAESVIAITLSWPLNRAFASADGGQGGGSHTVEFIGDIDLFLASRMRSTLAGIAAQSAELAVDVSGVRFIDASGLGLLAMMYHRVNVTGGQMTLLGLSPRLRRLLRITKLEYLTSLEHDGLPDGQAACHG
jgi:anti-sigma B factor antagonist